MSQRPVINFITGRFGWVDRQHGLEARATTRVLSLADEFDYIDPGPLIDGELELVPAAEAWLDAVMAAQNHPLTREQMPRDADIPRQKQLNFLSRLEKGFDPGDEDGPQSPAYYFWMHQRGAVEYPIVGAISLRLGRGVNIERVVGHIGYHVYPFARGQHYAERACRLLIPLARLHRLIPLWITCNPENIPSRRTCERLGAEFLDIVPVPPNHPLHARGEREKCRFRL